MTRGADGRLSLPGPSRLPLSMNCTRTLLSAVAAAASLLFGSAKAVEPVAIANVSTVARDYARQAALLVNGVPGNLLGGMGSGLTWAGGNVFLALPDRGPKALAWNAAVDHTTSCIPRFHTVTLEMLAVPDAAIGLHLTLRPSLIGTTLLFSRSLLTYGGSIDGHGARAALNRPVRHYFSGRSDNFDPVTSSADTPDARFDAQGIRVSANGRFVYVTDEYGPYLYQFDRASGARVRAINLPANLAAAAKSSSGAAEIAGNATGRVADKDMEGLAISPDGRRLFGLVQSPLIGDDGDGGRVNRVVEVDLETEKVRQYAYDNYLADKGKAYNSSEPLALNDHELLVLERDGKGPGDDSKAVVKRIYKLDIAGAADVSALSGESNLMPYAVPRSLFLDIVNKLTAAGPGADQIPAKLEGMAFGEDVVVAGIVRHTLYIANDSDFLATTPAGNFNPDQWFAFTFIDADLGGSAFVRQRFTPGAR